MDNIKYTAAYLHIVNAARIMGESQPEISSTLTELAKWIKDQYHIGDVDVFNMESLVKEVSDGK